MGRRVPLGPPAVVAGAPSRGARPVGAPRCDRVGHRASAARSTRHAPHPPTAGSGGQARHDARPPQRWPGDVQRRAGRTAGRRLQRVRRRARPRDARRDAGRGAGRDRRAASRRPVHPHRHALHGEGRHAARAGHQTPAADLGGWRRARTSARFAGPSATTASRRSRPAARRCSPDGLASYLALSEQEHADELGRRGAVGDRTSRPRSTPTPARPGWSSRCARSATGSTSSARIRRGPLRSVSLNRLANRRPGSARPRPGAARRPRGR